MPFNKASRNIAVELVPGRQSYRLMESVFFHDLETDIGVLVEKGFMTDLASIPRLARIIITNDDHRVRRAALVHDWIYRHKGKLIGFSYYGKVWPGYKQGLSRACADRIFYNALRCDGVSRLKAVLMWLGVRVGGWYVWSRR